MTNNGARPIDPTQLTKTALQHTVQDFPPYINAGAFLIGETVRGPILPAYGTKERDRMLRIYDQMEHNGLWQGAIAGLIKKIRSTPWEIKGDPYWANYYQAIFQHAQFGQGWGVFIALVLRDLLTQDYGAFVELIGPGDPTRSITGPLGDPFRRGNDPKRYYGIAHKDAWRCYVTGNPNWPVVYYSLMTGKLHRMHHSRIKRFTDMPNPDERYFGIGLCALSRCIGVAVREIRMGRYIDSFLDDKPKPGINTYSGMTEAQFNTIVSKFGRQQSVDSPEALFSKTLNLFSMDTGVELKVGSIPFSQTPEKFDWVKYVELDVNSLALGLGIDRQEIWELAGKALGSGAQSAILAQKAEGKFYGDTLQELERFFNNNFLPVGLEFRFKPKNTVGDTAQATIDLNYSQAVSTLSQVPNLTTGNELRQILASKSETFANVLTDEQGSVELDDSDVKRADQEVQLSDDAPSESIQAQPIDAKTQAGNKPTSTTQQTQKDYQATRLDFIDNLVDLIGATGSTARRRFGIVFRAQLRRLGQVAFQDGLRDGGVTDPLDEDDLAQVQHWLINQSEFVTQFSDDAYKRELSPAEVQQHATMWANKSLQEMYDSGRMSADRNGMYEWVLGRTEKHCQSCKTLDGQRHRFKQWYSKNILPKSERLACGGWNCDCKLVKSKEAARGRFL